MPNVAIIFAGGTGKRMNTRSKPKQFLELHGKPILVYTLEQFERHPEIDAVVLVILADWLEYTKKLLDRFEISKVKAVIPGAETAFASQREGVRTAEKLFPPDSVILVHDGVRPLLLDETISRNIESVRRRGSAITVTPAIETITLKTESGQIGQIIERSQVELAKAPQSFFLKDLLEAHRKAERDGLEFIDSASLMRHYGHPLFPVEGSPENIKITTPCDFYLFRAIVDARESSQIFGI